MRSFLQPSILRRREGCQRPKQHVFGKSSGGELSEICCQNSAHFLSFQENGRQETIAPSARNKSDLRYTTVRHAPAARREGSHRNQIPAKVARYPRDWRSVSRQPVVSTAVQATFSTADPPHHHRRPFFKRYFPCSRDNG